MSEDEARRAGNTEEPQDDVEAHRRHVAGANEEPQGEAAGEDDDFEAHRRLHNRPGKTG